MVASEQRELRWQYDWDTAMVRARQERRLLLIDIEKEN